MTTQVKCPAVIAHRGGRKWAPENTMAAFSKSLAAGVDGIELDVHRCASGELVVIHDSDIGRTTNGVGLVADISYPELKRVSAGLWFDQEFRGEYIPLLQEVLNLVKGKIVLNIEVKNAPVNYPGIDEDLLDVLNDYPHKETLIVSSFDHKLLRSLHSKAPDLRIGLLAEALFVDLYEYARLTGATVWHPGFGSLTKEAVAEAKASGLEVNVWTLNSTREWATALDMGVDGIVTDDPAGLMAFIQQTQKVRT